MTDNLANPQPINPAARPVMPITPSNPNNLNVSQPQSSQNNSVAQNVQSFPSTLINTPNQQALYNNSQQVPPQQQQIDPNSINYESPQNRPANQFRNLFNKPGLKDNGVLLLLVAGISLLIFLLTRAL